MTRLLLDTHAVIWALADDPSLPAATRQVIDAADDVYVSAASFWEIAIKVRVGKLSLPLEFVRDLEGLVVGAGLQPLPVAPAHALGERLLRSMHNDPFDRLLMSQALAEELVVISRDPQIDEDGVTRIWLT